MLDGALGKPQLMMIFLTTGVSLPRSYPQREYAEKYHNAQDCFLFQPRYLGGTDARGKIMCRPVLTGLMLVTW
jgi:hypothetical protein